MIQNLFCGYVDLDLIESLLKKLQKDKRIIYWGVVEQKHVLKCNNKLHC